MHHAEQEEKPKRKILAANYSRMHDFNFNEEAPPSRPHEPPTDSKELEDNLLPEITHNEETSSKSSKYSIHQPTPNEEN
eukprot:CAMPEP_0197011418 /NCGR_PEP_ID=MMETSP1380-20130617/58419_1 /TAXON_ID=5936 /ORGANISM="Euplotes crassus, Strain CT5" /LENGTH=78 /DNA_ID=CAMNT_0042434097 /DNA_START=33 /DNA_END=266 /DNA_ORIENTATION=+